MFGSPLGPRQRGKAGGRGDEIEIEIACGQAQTHIVGINEARVSVERFGDERARGFRFEAVTGDKQLGQTVGHDVALFARRVHAVAVEQQKTIEFVGAIFRFADDATDEQGRPRAAAQP